MISEERVKQFQEAVIKDCGSEAELDSVNARKVLEGTVSYLLTLEKIYLRIQNKKSKNHNIVQKADKRC